jgi:hypothetical protein
MAETVTTVPPSLRRYRLPRGILEQSVRALREKGEGVREAVILWQGRVLSATTAEITRLHVPEQDTGSHHFDVPLQERLRILTEISQAREFILVQLHTHPEEAFHSKADDRMAITKHTGAISVVVPDFGLRWTGDFAQTSVHMHLGGARWRKLPEAEVRDLFEVVPS